LKRRRKKHPPYKRRRKFKKGNWKEETVETLRIQDNANA
jgi:hypothetical protein